MFGNTIGRSAADTPYHDASVAVYCSTEGCSVISKTSNLHRARFTIVT
jgi:hypothetical protein